MYSGPGSTPLRSASVAWNLLAAELDSAANQYQATINVLADDDWRGPTSATMAAAVAPYIGWMATTGAQAEQAAAQASAAATAYETAFALTVPPPVIAANRTQLATLVATNVIGQNTPAIAATEALYGEMWAQDAAAMYGYAGSSATAAAVKAFTPPPETSNPAAQALQGSAVTAGQYRQHRFGRAVDTAADHIQRSVGVEAAHLAAVRGDECGYAASECARQPPEFPRRRGREPHRNVPELDLLERFCVGLIHQPRARHTGDHQRVSGHQLVAAKRRVGARRRRRDRPDHAPAAGATAGGGT